MCVCACDAHITAMLTLSHSHYYHLHYLISILTLPSPPPSHFMTRLPAYLHAFLLDCLSVSDTCPLCCSKTYLRKPPTNKQIHFKQLDIDRYTQTQTEAHTFTLLPTYLPTYLNSSSSSSAYTKLSTACL